MSTPPQTREWNATDYHRISVPQVSWGKKVLARVRLRGDEVLMDAGCGTGRLTAELLQNLPRGRVVGVDLSQNMLAGARDHLASDFGGKFLLVAADLQELPFEKVFDGIFSTAAFHWVLDHGRLFQSLFRALRPGGWLHAQCGGGPNLAQLRKRTDELAATAKYAPYFVGFREPWTFNDAKTAAALLRRAGFREVETSLEPASDRPGGPTKVFRVCADGHSASTSGTDSRRRTAYGVRRRAGPPSQDRRSPILAGLLAAQFGGKGSGVNFAV